MSLHDDLRDATVSRDQQFVEMYSDCLPMLLCELFEQERRLWLLSMPDSAYKDEVPGLRKMYLELRARVKELCGDEFEKTYKEEHADSCCEVNGKHPPMFDDEGFVIDD